MTDDVPATDLPSSRIDVSVPHSARIWNYWLDGKDNYAVDREVGDEFFTIFPDQVDIARHARAFLGRAVQYLAGEAGIRQFLDVGTGLPTADNTHQVAQRVAPDVTDRLRRQRPDGARPRSCPALQRPEGTTTYIHADLREPARILADAAEALDFDRPIAILMLGILGHIADEEGPDEIVAELVGALPSGSYLVINDGTDVFYHPEAVPHSSRPGRARSPVTSRPAESPTICALPSGSSTFSTASNCSTPVWSRCRGGGRLIPPSRCPNSTRSVALPARTRSGPY